MECLQKDKTLTCIEPDVKINLEPKLPEMYNTSFFELKPDNSVLGIFLLSSRTRYQVLYELCESVLQYQMHCMAKRLWTVEHCTHI